MSRRSPETASVWFFIGVWWITTLSLCAAPDPDLFDGRVASSPPPPPASAPSVEPQAAGGKEAQSEGGGPEEAASVARDLSEVDGVKVGEQVSAESSKTAEATERASNAGETTPAPTSGRDFESVGQAGGGESVERGSSPVDGTVAGGGGGGLPVEAIPEGATGGSGGGAVPAERSFEDFGFGSAGGVTETVEVNQSKRTSYPPAGSSTSSEPPTASTPPKSGSGGAGGAQPAAGNASSDYGSNLPSGL